MTTTTTPPPDHFPDAGEMVPLPDDAKPARIARLLAHIDAQAVRLEVAERDAAERAKAQATRLCDGFKRLGAVNRRKWTDTGHRKWEGMAIAYEQAALRCGRAAIASEAGK